MSDISDDRPTEPPGDSGKKSPESQPVRERDRSARERAIDSLLSGGERVGTKLTNRGRNDE